MSNPENSGANPGVADQSLQVTIKQTAAHPDRSSLFLSSQDSLPSIPQEETVAVLIFHGMGQQVPFETLDCVAKALLDSEPAAAPQPRVDVQFSKLGDEWLPRAELTLGAASGKPRRVHLYESYWAPLPEGRVSATDTFRFLLGAGGSGIQYSFQEVFSRWMFGGPQQLALRPATPYQLLLAFTIVCSLLVIVATFGVASLANILIGLNILWPENVLIDTLNDDLLCSPLLLAPVFLALKLVFAAYKRATQGMKPPPQRNALTRPPSLLKRAVPWSALILLFVWIIWSSAMILYHSFIFWGDAALLVPSPALDLTPEVHPWSNFFHLLFWLAAAYACFKCRWLVVQYLGDVAAYVSSHKVSKFHDLREKIKTVGNRVTQAVYADRNGEAGALTYDHVFVVGHSLGSVVAYDSLNAMINQDVFSGGALAVVKRTKLLFTFGSPLDKTAFIFRTQTRKAVVREALAAAVQPLIQDYAYRPQRWINLWSPLDWISGPLDYYDPPKTAADPAHDAQRVNNIEDTEATIPLLAHTQYWEHDAFAKTLYQAIVSESVPPMPD